HASGKGGRARGPSPARFREAPGADSALGGRRDGDGWEKRIWAAKRKRSRPARSAKAGPFPCAARASPGAPPITGSDSRNSAGLLHQPFQAALVEQAIGRRDLVGEQHALEVIVLVLDAAREQVARVADLEGGPV